MGLGKREKVTRQSGHKVRNRQQGAVCVKDKQQFAAKLEQGQFVEADREGEAK